MCPTTPKTVFRLRRSGTTETLLVSDMVTDLVTGHTCKRPSPNVKGPLTCNDVGSGGRILTCDLRVMSKANPVSYNLIRLPRHHSSRSPSPQRLIRPQLCGSVPWRLGHGSGHGPRQVTRHLSMPPGDLPPAPEPTAETVSFGSALTPLPLRSGVSEVTEPSRHSRWIYSPKVAGL